jgi:hypothetical protein
MWGRNTIAAALATREGGAATGAVLDKQLAAVASQTLGAYAAAAAAAAVAAAASAAAAA